MCFSRVKSRPTITSLPPPRTTPRTPLSVRRERPPLRPSTTTKKKNKTKTKISNSNIPFQSKSKVETEDKSPRRHDAANPAFRQAKKKGLLSDSHYHQKKKKTKTKTRKKKSLLTQFFLVDICYTMNYAFIGSNASLYHTLDL